MANRTEIIEAFENKKFKEAKNFPAFRSGDTVRVHYKIQEGTEAGKFRIQHFEGVVTRLHRGNTRAASTFTVRKISAGGVGVERVFPVVSPFVAKVELRATGAVRRSRLFYLRDLTGKAARIRSRFGVGDEGEAAEQAPEAAATPAAETTQE